MSSVAAPLLRVAGLTKDFQKSGQAIPVLRGVDLTIARKDMCSIRGQSGAGKSTLLHVIGTLDRPTAGVVEYEGEDIFSCHEDKLSAFRNRTIGFVFQFHHLLPDLTALENVMLPGLISDDNYATILERGQTLLKDVGLSHRTTHRPSELSGGEQQRVAIARALIMRPQIVFADEPTGNLDTKTSDAIHDLLANINDKHGIAFVVVTHNEKFATRLPRQLEMRDGLVYEVGD